MHSKLKVRIDENSKAPLNSGMKKRANELRKQEQLNKLVHYSNHIYLVEHTKVLKKNSRTLFCCWSYKL